MQKKIDNKYIVDRLYDLIIEANLNRSGAEILENLNENPDPDVDRFIRKVRFYRTKSKAQINKSRLKMAQEELQGLIKSYGKQLQDFLSGEEYTFLLKFHRNYKKSTEKDERSTLEDKKLLKIIEKMKKKLDDGEKG